MSERPVSVMFARDREVIPVLLSVHAPPDPFIVDATHNRGVMWKGSGVSPDLTVDIDPAYVPDHVADCRHMPFLADASVGVLAFDPPHLPAAVASTRSSGIERHQYGLTADGDYRQGDNVSPLFPAFLAEARRVLQPGGIVIAKLADLVHNHRYQWQHVDFIEAVRATDGLTACDAIVKVDPCASNLKSSKWQTVKHFRRGHCFWLVVRNGRCEP